MDFKEEIINLIEYKDIEISTLGNLITVPAEAEMGDYTLPCFSLAKILHKSPLVIADEIIKSIKSSELVDRVQNVNGYINFYLNQNYTCSVMFNKLNNCTDFGSNIGNGKTVCIDYCSVNLAKYMHIGHWATTTLGEVCARLYESQGYKVIRINYLGDYGTTFGKMAVGFKLWGDENRLNEQGINEIQDVYVKFSALADDNLLEKARIASKNIEDKVGEDYSLYLRFIELAKKEVNRLVKKVGIEFDDWRGESTYNGLMQKSIDEVKEKGLSEISQGALVVNLEKFNLGYAILQRNDGASLYLTRDLAAVEDRYVLYNFDEMIYVTAIEQNLHFMQLFKLVELLNKPYAGNLFHMSYGMFSLPEGKISSRKGKQALFEDILNLAEEKALSVIQSRNFADEEKEIIKTKIAKSAIAFSIIKTDRIKDKVFDLEKAISFDGETAPYIEYTCARCNSLIKKYSEFSKNPIIKTKNYADFDFSNSFLLIKHLYSVDTVIKNAFNKKEPSILAREVLDICQLFNKLYSETKIIDESNELRTDIYMDIVNITKNVLSYCMNILFIDIIEQM